MKKLITVLSIVAASCSYAQRDTVIISPDKKDTTELRKYDREDIRWEFNQTWAGWCGLRLSAFKAVRSDAYMRLLAIPTDSIISFTDTDTSLTVEAVIIHHDLMENRFLFHPSCSNAGTLNISCYSSLLAMSNEPITYHAIRVTLHFSKIRQTTIRAVTINEPG